MSDIPTSGQLVLLSSAIAVYAVGGAASLRRILLESRNPLGNRTQFLRLFAKASLYLGTVLTIGVLTWHCIRRENYQPLDDNFGAFLSLAILLSLFVSYTQRAKPLRGLDFFIMPAVLLLLILAAVFGKTVPHEYRDTTWSYVHRISAYGGFVAFAVAGAVGGMYLLATRRLRAKKFAPGDGFGSLERLENLTFIAVTLGFALLTVGLITGFVRVLSHDGTNSLGPTWYRNPKVILTCVAWVVYALVLHSPINPSFRGRKAAILSVVGLILMVGVFVAVQFTR